MTISTAIATTKIDHLLSILFTTLDEKVFFLELSKLLNESIANDSIKIFKVLDDTSAKLIVMDGKTVEDGMELLIGEGSTGHVIRTKRPYFSNNVSRDPIFSKSVSGNIKAELALPVIHDGMIIATIHFQSNSDDRNFSREDIVTFNSIITHVERPLINLKMYLSAKLLNESLLKKIEEKEKELKQRAQVVKTINEFKISEPNLVGQSASFLQNMKLAQKVANSDVMLLLIGPSGSGKEALARTIHCQSDRSEGAFNVFDCSSIADQRMLEIELWGSKENKFVPGSVERAGLFERSNGGTLLLKRIECLSLPLQAKLLMYIKEGQSLRVGEHISYQTNVRLLVSANADLASKVEQSLFREDLFYILNTIVIRTLGLSERQDDIELLANHFLNSGKNSKDQKTLSPCVIKALKEYTWPGNIRELQNVIERAYILADGAIIDSGHLADHVLEKKECANEIVQEEKMFRAVTLEELEKEHICCTLNHLEGNKTKSAKILGITVKTLYNKLHSYGMIAAVDKEI